MILKLRIKKTNTGTKAYCYRTSIYTIYELFAVTFVCAVHTNGELIRYSAVSLIVVTLSLCAHTVHK